MPGEEGGSGAKAKGQSEVDKETGTGTDSTTATVPVPLHPESQTPVATATTILTEAAALASSDENGKKSRPDERKLEPASVSFNKNSRMPTSHHSIDAATRLSQQEGNANQGPKPKSVSMDAMTKKGVSKRSNGASLPNDNNNDTATSDNGQTKRESRTVIGRLFWSHKVSPALLQEVVTIHPVLCPTSDGNRCLSCSHSQQRVDIPHQLPEITRSNDSMENICRICHDSPKEEKLIAPCLCKGSMGKVHRTCLERWLGESGKSACEICGQEYNTVRIPKYTGFRSLIAWIRNPLSPTDSRNFFFDMACFFILTPLACLSAWLCALGAKHYSLEEHRLNRRYLNETMESRANRDASNSTWTSVGLLSLTGTLVAAYCIWIFVAIRYHLQVWREWRQRNFVVTIVPLSNGDFSRSPPPLRLEEALEANPGSADSSSSSVERRVREVEEADRNNNANLRGFSPDPPRLPHPERDFVNDSLLLSPAPEYSETALFYQTVFGGDSNESLSEETQIRLAVLRSQADACKGGNPPQRPMNSSEVEVAIKSELSAVQLSASVNAASDENAGSGGSSMKLHPNSSSSTISSNKAQTGQGTIVSILTTDGPTTYQDESSTDETARKQSSLDNRNLSKDTEVKPDVIIETRKNDADEPVVVLQGEIQKNNNADDEGQ